MRRPLNTNHRLPQEGSDQPSSRGGLMRSRVSLKAIMRTRWCGNMDGALILTRSQTYVEQRQNKFQEEGVYG